MARLLRTSIVMGEYALGQRLTEAELARRYGTNHRVVREALGALAGEGLIVRDAYSRNMVFNPSPKEIDGIRLSRAALESMVAAIAAYRIRPEGVARLRKQAEIPGGSFSSEEQLAEWDMNIHALIWEIAGEPALTNQLERLISRAMACNLTLTVDPEAFEFEKTQDPAHVTSHFPLIDAICAGDPERARKEMIRHLTHASPNREFEQIVALAFGLPPKAS